MARWLELTTPEGRKIAVDADMIESVVEHPVVRHSAPIRVPQDGEDPYEEPGGCDINMRSGDTGKVREPYDKVLFAILNEGFPNEEEN